MADFILLLIPVRYLARSFTCVLVSLELVDVEKLAYGLYVLFPVGKLGKFVMYKVFMVTIPMMV